MQHRRRVVWVFLLAVFVVFLVANRLASRYIQYAWLHTMGYGGVFWRVLDARLLVGTVGGLFVGLVLFTNLAAVRLDLSGLTLTDPSGAAWPLWPRRRVSGTAVAAVVGAGAGLFAGLALSGEWALVLRFLNQVPFGLTDPLFHKNVAFYVFTLPFLELAYQVAGLTLLGAIVLVALAHAASGRIAWSAGTLHLHRRAGAHVALLLGLYLALKSGGYVLDAYNLVYSTRGVVYGASYADVHAALPALRILTVLALAAAGVAFLNVFRPAARPLAIAVGGLAACSLLLGTGYPALLEAVDVRPNELRLERPYIADNIAMTRAAYDLTKIQPKPFVPQNNLTAARLDQAVSTIRNVRLWSGPIGQEDFRQQQGLRSYYQFDPITVDRYTVDGHYREVIVSGRELNYAALSQPTWINVHLKYTHGYGAVMTPASVVGHSGLPAYWLSNIPPHSPVGLKLTRPQIYYGEQPAPYAIVDTNTREFDYPAGQQDVYRDYKGTGGIPLGSPLNRLAFALHEDNYNILLTSAINAHSKALIHRGVRQRVQAIAPFLQYEQRPYLVVYHGGLYWILDAYTTSNYFPYSQPAPGTSLNYIRNSVKVVVNAYTGQANFYVADPRDPLIRTYERIFPQLFRPLAAMPAGLRAHIRYPTAIFQLQMTMYSKYHMTSPDVFYNREDLWRPAQEIVGSTRTVVAPYYVIIQLPGASRAEFLLMEPFTPNGKDNMVAWVGVRNDGPHYGQMVAYEFPKGVLTFGPLQVDARINEDPAIAQDLTLWSRQGSHISRGRLVTVPLGKSLLYVEPIYQTAAGAQLPELRRVIVAYGKRIGFQPTLDGALSAIFGSAPPLTGPDVIGARRTAAPAPAAAAPTAIAPAAAPPATAASASGTTAKEAEAIYQAALTALQQRNFTAFGQDLTRLGPLLAHLSGSKP